MNVTDVGHNGTDVGNNDTDVGNNDIHNFQFWAYGVVANTICGLGIIGNIFAVIVLGQRKMRSSMSCYLIAQAIFDCIVLLTTILSFNIPIISTAYNCVYPYLHPVNYPLALTSQTGTIYITISFTVERYIAVCRPFQASNMCTPKRAIRVSLLVTFLSIGYNIPRTLESYIAGPNAELNVTCPTTQQSVLGLQPLYRSIYLTYMYTFVIFLLPFLLLFTLNILLLRAVKDSQRARCQMNASTARENNMTVMVIVVVLVFLVCQLPALLDNIFYAFIKMDSINIAFFTRFTTISTLMVSLNSAINFLLYCVFGNKFRRVFLQIFCCRSPGDRNETSMQMLRSTRAQARAGAFQRATDAPRNGSRKNQHANADGVRNNNHVNGHTQFIDPVDEDVEPAADHDDPHRRLITSLNTDEEV